MLKMWLRGSLSGSRWCNAWVAFTPVQLHVFRGADAGQAQPEACKILQAICDGSWQRLNISERVEIIQRVWALQAAVEVQINDKGYRAQIRWCNKLVLHFSHRRPP